MSEKKLTAEEKLSVLLEASLWCYEMLRARDEMNSKVHCAPVKYSPITERLCRAIELFDDKRLW